MAVISSGLHIDISIHTYWLSSADMFEHSSLEAFFTQRMIKPIQPLALWTRHRGEMLMWVILTGVQHVDVD